MLKGWVAIILFLGWSRFVLPFENLTATVTKLKQNGVMFKMTLLQALAEKKFSVKILRVMSSNSFSQAELVYNVFDGWRHLTCGHRYLL